MAYSISITEVTPVVTATSTQNNISVTTENKIFTITESTFVITATSVLSTVTIYTDAVELLVDDFANYFKEDWVSGRTYRRGQLVNDRYSLFVCSTGTLTTVTSTINPSDYRDTLSWTRVVWNEAPRSHLTVTNYFNVGTTATVSGPLSARGLVTISTSGSRPVGPVGADTTSLLTNDGMTWLAGNTAIGDRNFPAEAPQPPTSNRTFSLVVYGNQFVTSSTTIAANLSVGGLSAFQNIVVNKSASVAENLNVLGVTTSGNLVVTNTASILGSLSVGDITGNGGLTVAGPLRVNGISTFTNFVNFLGTATFNNDVVFVKDLTVPNLTATNSLRVAGVLYPVNTGSYGQVIANMGDYTAEWRNLGDLNFWSLNDDLKTNGFNLITGIAGDGSAPELRIVRGTDQSNSYDHSSLNFYGALDGFSGGSVELYGRESLALTAGTRFTPYGSTDHRPHIILNPASGNDGTINIRAATIDLSNTNITDVDSIEVNTINGNAGDYIHIANPGFEFSDGTRLNTALPDISDVLPIASSSVLGGIKVGSRLAINSITGVLSADDQSYTLPTASSTILGGIKVGGGLSINSGILSVINTGTGYFSTTTVSLGSTMFTNGYSIRWAEGSNSFLDINQNTVFLQANEDISISASDDVDITADGTLTIDGGVTNILGTNSTTIQINTDKKITIDTDQTNVKHTTKVNVDSPYIQLGAQSTGHTDIGELRVQKIYNYAGTYAPFFPAGIQLADNTVQITAYHPDGGPLPAV
jgi:hypothetical protein